MRPPTSLATRRDGWTRTTVDVPSATLARIERAAKRNGRSRTQEIARLLDEALEARAGAP